MTMLTPQTGLLEPHSSSYQPPRYMTVIRDQNEYDKATQKTKELVKGMPIGVACGLGGAATTLVGILLLAYPHDDESRNWGIIMTIGGVAAVIFGVIAGICDQCDADKKKQTSNV